MRNLIAAGAVALSIASMSVDAQTPHSCELATSEHVFARRPSGDLKAHVFSPVPKDAAPRAAIVIFHGGGWVMGEPSWGFTLVDRYACKGMVAIVAQYRLSDQKTASPAEAADDAMDVIAWARANAAQFNLDPNRIAALGWSAGAHLAASAAIFSSDAKQRPNVLALVSPAVSVVEDDHFRALFPPGTKIEQFSPAEHVRASLPATIMVTGRTDTVTPLMGVTKFHERMLAAGNESELHVYEGVGHLFTPSDQPDNGFPKPDRAVQEKAYDAIDQFLVKRGYMRSK